MFPAWAPLNNAIVLDGSAGAAGRAASELATVYAQAGVEVWALWVPSLVAELAAPDDDHRRRLAAAGHHHARDAHRHRLGRATARRRRRDVDRHPRAGLRRRAAGRAAISGGRTGNPGLSAWVMVQDGVAVATTWAFLHGTDCGIYAVETLPQWRRRGLARALVEHVLHHASRAGRPHGLAAVHRDGPAPLRGPRLRGRRTVRGVAVDVGTLDRDEPRRRTRPGRVRVRSRDAEEGGGDSVDGVPLTNLDQPLFDGRGRDQARPRRLPRRASRDRILPVLRDRPLSVIRVHRGQEPFMQKNVPKYAPDWVQTVTLWAETSSARWRTRCATTAARCCGSPTSGRSSTTRRSCAPTDSTTPPTSCSTSTRPRATAFAAGRARRRTSSAPGARRRRARRGGEDQRRQGRARLRARSTRDAAVEDAAAATRAIAARAERLDPALATTAFVKEDRGGKVFVDATRVGGATVVAAYSPRARPGVAGVVPGAAGTTSTTSSPADFTVHTALDRLGRRDPWADADARAAAAARRPGRGGPRDPGRPGAGDARGQAPGPGPARGRPGRRDQLTDLATGRARESGFGTVGP